MKHATRAVLAVLIVLSLLLCNFSETNALNPSDALAKQEILQADGFTWIVNPFENPIYLEPFEFVPHDFSIFLDNIVPILPTTGEYMLCDEWGGNWSDVEKLKANDDDDLMCWALAASNPTFNTLSAPDSEQLMWVCFGDQQRQTGPDQAL